MPTSDTQVIFDEKCEKGLHPFKILLRIGGDQESIVARWCNICGAAVIDRDYDDRIQPGAIMQATRPKIFDSRLVAISE